MRAIHHEYEDPLDRVWLACAERTGLRVVREPGAYASTDGRGTLAIAVDAELDADDSLAQMVFHELCHALVEGPESFEAVDWGLDNTGDDDVAREHACLRLQAHLARPRGLGRVLAPTTDFRAFYDALGPDPFAGPPDDRSVVLAKKAAARVGTRPWAPHLLEALDATATIAAAASTWGASASRSLWSIVEPAAPRHAVGFPLPRAGASASHETCASCGFFRAGAGARGRCVKASRATRQSLAACERWEPAPACERCGACCREAFDVLVVSPRDPFARKHRALLVVRDDGTLDLPRPGGRCPPLRGEGTDTAPYRCAIHEERPRTCRDFAVGGHACWTARRRVGLSL
jgi:hypothetical protein